MHKYRCRVCGYIYDPARGDVLGGVPAGTPFAELPPNWECPICGVGTEEFAPIA